jgi:hypothetical protein
MHLNFAKILAKGDKPRIRPQVEVQGMSRFFNQCMSKQELKPMLAYSFTHEAISVLLKVSPASKVYS